MVVVLSVSTHTDIVADACICMWTHNTIFKTCSLSVPVSKGEERRDRKEKENRKGGFSYSYFIHTLTSLFKNWGGRGAGGGGSAPTY